MEDDNDDDDEDDDVDVDFQCALCPSILLCSLASTTLRKIIIIII